MITRRQRQALGAIDQNRSTSADGVGKIDSRAATPTKKETIITKTTVTPFVEENPHVVDVAAPAIITKKTPFQSPILQKKRKSAVTTPIAPITVAPPAEINAAANIGPLTIERNQKIAFDALCEDRVGDDADGILSDLGIKEWSYADFTILQKIGSGACATVYAAREKTSGYTVALKIQDADTVGDCYFDDEVDIHETLRHDSIVNMYGYFYSDEEPPPPCKVEEKAATYLCMILELCDGKDLLAMAKEAPNRRLEEKKVAAYFRGAIESLEYIHAAECIHCDVKPSNFMLHRNKVKLVDFGMAVRSEEREVIGGSPVYMSPEHLLAWRAFNDNFDKRVDVYSLGVVLYELLVGHLPYEVIENAEDYAEYLIVSSMSKINIGRNKREAGEGGDKFFQPPMLDLRNLNDLGPVEPFKFPALRFPTFVCDEAKDLISGLMRPSADERMTLDQARSHAWVEKFQ